MINSIPLSDLNFEKYDDQDVINAYNWFMTFMTPAQWRLRKQAIEDYLGNFHTDSPPLSQPVSEGLRLVIDKDRIGWYLYLLHCLINEPHKYEYYQGARIVPLFKRIGIDIDVLDTIKGVKKKVSDLIKKRTSEADSLIFELLAALTWRRNGYEVEFIPETNEKSPDFLAWNDGVHFQVECKRQQKSGVYNYEETEKRQKLVHHIAPFLLKNNILLDVTFLVELKSLPETYLLELFRSQRKRIKAETWSISTEFVDIRASKLDIENVNNYLSKYHVKDKSPHLLELLAKRPIDYDGFTIGLYASYYHVGERLANNLYVNNIANGFGVICNCVADRAYIEKARDVNGLLYKAMEQLTLNYPGVVHIGMETFDGPNVEAERLRKISQTMEKIDVESSKLRWIFYHYFQSYARSYQDWTFDESVDIATPYYIPISPLPKNFLVLPDDADILESSWHWERPLP